ncbi:MAG: bacteriohemerythrin [Magnetococcales bacterium]|nr:bacteriohemerythrin [Magnetococcales bacterium]MBF0114587.1 bacteriohemerythrin [Magnetococcales bacterium]
MDSFRWNALFETGLTKVDAQHRRLVEWINQLGEDVDTGVPEKIGQTVHSLAAYTVYHFQTEEDLMAEQGVFTPYVDAHRATHQRFIAQVTEWIAQYNRGQGIDLKQLLDFLSNWLIFHILGDDQSLGRQLRAIQGGVAAEQAYRQDHTSEDPRTEILLGALQRLYGGLVARNAELLQTQQALTELNVTLENRVLERTASLFEANKQLQEEQEKLLEAEKMASLGRMVAGFAHEINTPIGVAVGSVSQVRELVRTFADLATQEEVDEATFLGHLHLLDEVSQLTQSNLQRAAELVHSFKRTAVHQGSTQERYYDLAELMEDVHKSLAGEFKHTPVQVLIQCPANLVLYGPAGALVQVLVNLLQNSRIHAFAEGTLAGTIQIAAHVHGQQLCIDYRDDGAGMSEACLRRAFEPFFTTRRHSGGSGLGLYICYNLVTHALNGKVHCSSVPGEGVHFHIELPLRLHASEEQHS